MAEGPLVPGYFALVMGTGIVAVAARLLGHPAVAWPLFAITLSAYPVLWAILLARIVIFPRAVVADFVSHGEGPPSLPSWRPMAYSVANLPRSYTRGPAAAAVLVQHRAVGIAGIRFPRRGDRNTAKPDLAHGLNGSWLLLVVATGSLAVLGSFPALRSGEAPALVFASLAFYLFGAMLYVSAVSANFLPLDVPPHASRRNECAMVDQHGCCRDRHSGRRAVDGAPGHRSLPSAATALCQPLHGAPWATSTFWIPLLVMLFVWKEMQCSRHGYDPELWSMVFPLGMYAAATDQYATVAHLPFLR